MTGAQRHDPDLPPVYGNGATMTGAQRHDPNALLVTRRVQEAAQPAVTILFGSRARGDYRPDSDIDLLLIADRPPEPPAMQRHCPQQNTGICRRTSP